MPVRTTVTLLVVLAGCWRGDSSSARLPITEPGVRVTSMPELLAALRPGATIVLGPGAYAIDELPRESGPHHRWAHVFEGSEYAEFDDKDMLVLENLRDVTIRAERKGTRLVTAIASSTVLVLKDCTNVTLQDLSIGHSVAGTCGGGVITVLGGANVRITGCELSGSGTFGVEAYRTKDLRVTGSRIFHTSEGAVRIFETDGASITDTVIDDNKTLDNFFHIHGSRRVALERLVIKNNHYTDTAVDDQAMFAIGDTEGVTLRDSELVGNSSEFFRRGDLKISNVTQRDNRWSSEAAP